MYRNPRLFISLLVIAIGAILAGCGEHLPKLPTEGSMAPEFTLMNQDGKPVSLNDYRGQWVVLHFYERDFNRQDTADMHNFEQHLDKLQQQHAVLLGISSNSAATHKAFADKAHLPFTFLSDRGLNVEKQYGLVQRTHFKYYRVIYSTFIIDPGGKIARVFFDFGPSDPGGEVLNALNKLQSPLSSMSQQAPAK